MKAISLLTLTGALGLSQDFVWEPYRFKPYERYIYEYKEVLGGKPASGGFEIIVRRGRGSFRVSIKGTYRKWKGSVSRNFGNAEELSGFILMKMYFDHPWLIPLGRTVLSRGLVRILTSKPIDWSPGRKRVDGMTFRVVRECEVGNLRGRMLEIVEKGEVYFRMCASPSASMPVYLYRKSGKGDAFEIKLIEYSDLK